MSKPRVAFLELVGNETSVFQSQMRLPLMGTLYLGTILEQAGFDVHIYNENILPGRIDPFDIEADVYCISSLTVSASRARSFAVELRHIYPSARIIVGGIHASLLPEEFTDVADHVVIGEAEALIVDLVEGRIAQKIVAGAPVADLDALPVVNYGLLEGCERMDVIPVMTSRGCPFDCNFCTVTKVFGKRFRMQSPGRVMKEIASAFAQFGRRPVFFYDDNLTANRERMFALCELLEREQPDITWTAQVRSDVARDAELVKRMERAGCRRFFIGFESINDETLKAMHKSQTRSDIESAIRTIHSLGVSIHGMFIFGEDHDTTQSLRATVDFAIHEHLDTVQFMVLTPFPGTRVFEDLEGQNRMIHKRWDFYDGMYAVFRPAQMSAVRLQQETVAAYERFYSFRRLLRDTLRLAAEIFVDALTWDFSRVYRYTFDVIFLKAGGRVLVGRYARNMPHYMAFLEGQAKAGRVERSASA